MKSLYPLCQISLRIFTCFSRTPWFDYSLIPQTCEVSFNQRFAAFRAWTVADPTLDFVLGGFWTTQGALLWVQRILQISSFDVVKAVTGLTNNCGRKRDHAGIVSARHFGTIAAMTTYKLETLAHKNSPLNRPIQKCHFFSIDLFKFKVRVPSIPSIETVADESVISRH